MGHSEGSDTVTGEELAEALDRYGDMVYRIAFGALGRREDAEDVAQEVFLKLFRAEKNFDSAEHRRFWLARVTVNECRRAVRWYKRNVPVGELPETGAEDGRNELLETVMALPEKLRVATVLYYYEGYSTKEIARLAKVPEATVRTRLSRARERLREFLKEEEDV